MKGLRLGAVVLLDALGFKGIWNRTDPKSVLRQLKSLKREGQNLQGIDRSGVLLQADALDHRVRCISDTIIVAVTLRDSAIGHYPERPIYRAMLSAALIASHMMGFALDGSPQFLFRGCMATGRLNIDGDFLIGPAIDEAAELFEQSDGPFFWMAPSALRINDSYADTFVDRIEPNLMVRYPIPVKNGKSIETLVHNYFGLTQSPNQRAITRENVLHAFGSTELSPEVEKKRCNTLSFLNHIQQIATTSSRYRKFKFRLPHLEDITYDQKMYILKHAGPDTLLSFNNP